MIPILRACLNGQGLTGFLHQIITIAVMGRLLQVAVGVINFR